RVRQLRRGALPRSVPVRYRPHPEPAPLLRARRSALLPRRTLGQARGQDLARGDDPVPRRHRACRPAGAVALEHVPWRQAAPGQDNGMTEAKALPDPEAVVSTLRAQGVRAVRLLYSDLHGVARGKDIPLGHFAEMVEDGTAFCSAVMGTDLRHTPVVGGAEGYVDFAVRPDLDTLRAAPTWRAGDPTEGEVASGLGEAWTLDGAEHWPVCPRALLRRVVDRFAERDLTPIVAPELEYFICERDSSSHGGLRRYVDELSRVYTVGPVSDPRELTARM